MLQVHCPRGHAAHWHMTQSLPDSCGAACVAMVLSSVDYRMPPPGFETDALKVKTAKKGLNADDLVKLLGRNSVLAAFVKMEDPPGAALRNTHGGKYQDYPILLQVLTQGPGSTTDIPHWIVVGGRVGDTNQFCILDPARKEGTLTHQAIGEGAMLSEGKVIMMPSRNSVRLLAIP